jgi:hypothetical protein
MLNAHSIPYNPSGRAVGVFASFGIVLGVLNRFPWFQSRLSFGAAVGFMGIAVLLFLRRTVWKRVLTIADDAFVVPVGFLRLRPTPLFFASIRRVWVTEIFGTAILRIRTAERDIEVQDIYLPNRTVFWDLKRVLESSAPRTVARNQNSHDSAV